MTEHPSSWRLHRVHPALGLEELDHDVLFAPKAYELGVGWLALPSGERAHREADFEAALRAAAGADSGWQLELVERDGTLGIHMDRWKAPTLQRELLDHVWEAARQRNQRTPHEALAEQRERESGRLLRAHLRVGASRLGERPLTTAAVVLAIAGVLGWDPLGWL